MSTSNSLPSLVKAEQHCGSRAKLAAKLDVGYSRIGMWHQRLSIPNEMLLPIEEATGRKVTVYDLLADMAALAPKVAA